MGHPLQTWLVSSGASQRGLACLLSRTLPGCQHVRGCKIVKKPPNIKPVHGMQVPDAVRLVPGDGSIAWRGDARYLATNTRARPGMPGGTRPLDNVASASAVHAARPARNAARCLLLINATFSSSIKQYSGCVQACLCRPLPRVNRAGAWITPNCPTFCTCFTFHACDVSIKFVIRRCSCGRRAVCGARLEQRGRRAACGGRGSARPAGAARMAAQRAPPVRRGRACACSTASRPGTPRRPRPRPGGRGRASAGQGSGCERQLGEAERRVRAGGPCVRGRARAVI